MKKIVEEARELLALVEQYGLEEIQLETQGLKFRALRSHAPQPGPAAARVEAAPASSAPASAAPEPVLAPPPPPPAENTVPIASPMVGTFYRAAGPGKPAFVQDGSTVEVETTVCIVEAMKLMNEIKAGVRGTIVSCSVENETPVKAGQTLFLVRPA